MSTYTKAHWMFLAFNLILAAGFSVHFLQAVNYEFLAYAGSIVVVALVLFATLPYTRFSPLVLVGVSLWALLHMLGGTIMTSDGVLYAYKIYPFFDGGGDFYVLKMDQVIHAFLYGVVGVMMLHLLRQVLQVQSHTWLVAAIAIFAAAGFSIVNEIVEFWAAVNIPGNGVGGYHNTVLDLIFNLLGATLAVVTTVLFGKKSW